MKPVTLRLHASSLGGRIAALVSSVAGGDALAAATIAAPSIDLLARSTNLSAVIRGCEPPMLRDSDGREIGAGLGC